MCNRPDMRMYLSNGLGIQLGGNPGFGCCLFPYLTPCQRVRWGPFPDHPGSNRFPQAGSVACWKAIISPTAASAKTEASQERQTADGCPRMARCPPNGSGPGNGILFADPRPIILHCSLPLQPFTAAGRKPGRCATDLCLGQGVGVCWRAGVLGVVSTPDRRGTEVLSPTKTHKPTSRLATLGQNTRARHMPSGLLKR